MNRWLIKNIDSTCLIVPWNALVGHEPSWKRLFCELFIYIPLHGLLMDRKFSSFQLNTNDCFRAFFIFYKCGNKNSGTPIFVRGGTMLLFLASWSILIYLLSEMHQLTLPGWLRKEGILSSKLVVVFTSLILIKQHHDLLCIISYSQWYSCVSWIPPLYIFMLCKRHSELGSLEILKDFCTDNIKSRFLKNKGECMSLQ